MSKVKQIHNEIIVEQSASEVRNIITAKLQSLKGKIVQSDDRRIECDFGSLMKSRLIGEFWVSKSTLPKKAIIELGNTEGGGTKVTLDVQHTHKFGFKMGFVKKYEEALKELSDSILSSIGQQ